jgi:5'-3' exonuclease
MGIKNLNKFLRKTCPDIFVDKKLGAYAGKRFAIDINLYLYRFKSTFNDRWVGSFFTFLTTMMQHNIDMVCVYDSKAPVEKAERKGERRAKKDSATRRITEIEDAVKTFETSGEIPDVLQSLMSKYQAKAPSLEPEGVWRSKSMMSTLSLSSVHREISLLKRQTTSLTKDDLAMSKQILELVGVKYLHSHSEGETLCAWLCVHGHVDAVLSNDTDVMVYETPCFLSKFDVQRQTITEIRYDDILERLQLTPAQFTDYCIMSGTDYNVNIFRIGSEKSYKLLKDHGSIDAIGAETELDISVLNHERVRELFKVPEILPNVEPTLGTPDVHQLLELLVSKRVSAPRDQFRALFRHLQRIGVDDSLTEEEMDAYYVRIKAQRLTDRYGGWTIKTSPKRSPARKRNASGQSPKRSGDREVSGHVRLIGADAKRQAPRSPCGAVDIFQ